MLVGLKAFDLDEGHRGILLVGSVCVYACGRMFNAFALVEGCAGT